MSPIYEALVEHVEDDKWLCKKCGAILYPSRISKAEYHTPGCKAVPALAELDRLLDRSSDEDRAKQAEMERDLYRDALKALIDSSDDGWVGYAGASFCIADCAALNDCIRHARKHRDDCAYLAAKRLIQLIPPQTPSL